MENKAFPQDILDSMAKDRKVRIAITKESHQWFFPCYFPDYIKYPTAPFQKEIFQLTEQEEIKSLYVCGFRGCAKSTILTLSYPIWAILGVQQKKFVVIVCQTQNQSKQRMMNLRHELEQNKLLKNDLGPFREESNEWGSSSLVFSNYNARITVASMEQSIRGLIHGQYRPDLIILDDVEDIDSTRTREGRDKTYHKLKGDIIPAGDQGTRLVVVGNLLHEDSLLMRMKHEIEENVTEGIFKEYPLLDENGNFLWLGKYPDLKAIETERKKVGSNIVWQREYLLKIVSDYDQVILEEWIRYYINLLSEKCRSAYIAVDPAVSEKDKADFTAIVVAVIEGYGDKFVARILPNPINKRMRFPEIILQIKNLYNSLKLTYPFIKILVEDVSSQRYIIQQLENERYPVEGVKVITDKHSRLVTVSHLIQNGKIEFSKHGTQELIQQLLGFEVETHDDLVDAFILLAHKMLEEDIPLPGKLSDLYDPKNDEYAGGICSSSNFDNHLGISRKSSPWGLDKF